MTYLREKSDITNILLSESGKAETGPLVQFSTLKYIDLAQGIAVDSQ